MPEPIATWRLLTPPGVPAAIAIIEITGDTHSAMSRLGVAPLEIGASGVRDLFGLDRGFAVRWSIDLLWLMPHGGPALVRHLLEELSRAGLARAEAAAYPEARGEIARRMLETLARARSPLAIELLLDQPRRWSGRDLDAADVAPRSLDRLIWPALVVAVGAPNIGKSTLANALAGRAVSLVADAPGTTRDAVGVLVDFGGVVARYLDTPGFQPSTRSEPHLESDVHKLARALAANADLVLRCGDATTSAPGSGLAPARAPHITVALRSDLGTPDWPHDLAVCARVEGGLEELAGWIREALVPARDLSDPRPWRFWEPRRDAG